MWIQIIWPVAALGGLGLVLGVGLAIAAKMLAVETDPNIEKIRELLPGANCGGCGFPGCDAFAQALAAQTTASNRTRRAWELGEAPLAEYLLTLRNLRQTRLGEAQARIDALQASALVRIDAHALWHSKEAHADAPQ